MLCIAVGAAVNLLFLVDQLKDMDDALLHRGDAARILAADHIRQRFRQSQMLFLVQMQEAIAALSTATAKAVQRIPDAHCNGDMSRALEYARHIKQSQRDFLQQQGIKHIYEDD